MAVQLAENWLWDDRRCLWEEKWEEKWENHGENPGKIGKQWKKASRLMGKIVVGNIWEIIWEILETTGNHLKIMGKDGRTIQKMQTRAASISKIAVV